MKKVIFKGTINGKEFDSVQDYNNAMTNLLKEGATCINASSSTQIVDEVSEKKDVKLVNELPKKEDFLFDVNNYTPYFKDEDEYYLDRLVSDDKDLNEKNFTNVDENLYHYYVDLTNDLKNKRISLEDSFDLINMFKNIRTILNSDSDDNTEAINSLTESIKRDTKKLELVKNAKPMIDIMKEFYNNSFNIVKDYILNR